MSDLFASHIYCAFFSYFVIFPNLLHVPTIYVAIKVKKKYKRKQQKSNLKLLTFIVEQVTVYNIGTYMYS